MIQDPEVDAEDDDLLDAIWDAIGEEEGVGLERHGNRPDPSAGGRFTGSDSGDGAKDITYRKSKWADHPDAPATEATCPVATKRVLGKEMTRAQLAAFAGIPDGSTVSITVSVHEGGPKRGSGFNDHVMVEGKWDGGSVSLTFTKGDSEVYLGELKLTKKGTGEGTKIFSEMVDRFDKAGFKSIAGELSRDRGMNGYYTWARLGFKPTDEVRDRNDNKVNLLKLMQTPEGRALWKKDGETWMGNFDIRAGSSTRKILEAYMREKAKAKKR